MSFDRNPKPVQFIQPNVLHRACLSVGKDDGFADQFRLHLTVVPVGNLIRLVREAESRNASVS